MSDIRDNNTYVVRKPADGNCWMVQNLDMDLSTSVTLTSSNTDIGAGATFTPSDNTVATGVGYTDWQLKPDNSLSYDPGNYYYNGGWHNNGTAYNQLNYYASTTGQPWEHIGNNYNWNAATASTGASTTTSGDAPGSICAKGWRLPRAYGDKSFTNLFSVYNIANSAIGAQASLLTPINLVFGGWYNYPGENERGSAGTYWLSTAYDTNNSYYLTVSIDSNWSHGASRNHKTYGFTIRCVAR